MLIAVLPVKFLSGTEVVLALFFNYTFSKKDLTTSSKSIVN